MIVNKYYKVIRVIKDGDDALTPFYIENISGEDGQFVTGSTETYHKQRNLMYKVDDGEWFEYTDDGTMKIDVPNGSRIYLKGDNPLVGSNNNHRSLRLYKKGKTTHINYNIGGYLTSLIRSTNFDEVDTIPDYSFACLFYQTKIVSASNLITSNIKYVGTSTFQQCFNECTSLSSLPDGMFANLTTVISGTFYQCFSGCTSLTSLPDGMFANVTTVSSSAFGPCFQDCTSLTSLPDGMFANVTTVGDYAFKYCFSGCTSLTSLPDGMFANLTTVSSQSFQQCFQECTSLTSLPEGMFANVTTVSSSAFYQCFQGCTSLTSLPEGMFANLTTVSSQSFKQCFYGCTSLTSLPDGVFANLTTVSSYAFQQCFYGCTSLLIGANFKKITGSTSHDAFDGCYKDCTSLQLIYAPQMSTWNESYFQDWVSGVYPTGKMYVKSGVVPPTGTSGVPEGWQLLNY